MSKLYWNEKESSRDWTNIDSYIKSITNSSNIKRFQNTCKNISYCEFRRNAHTTFFRDCIHRLLGDSTSTHWTGISREIHMDILSYYVPDFWEIFLPVAEDNIDSRTRKAMWKFKVSLGLTTTSTDATRIPYTKALQTYQAQYEEIHTNWRNLISQSIKRMNKVKQNQENQEFINLKTA